MKSKKLPAKITYDFETNIFSALPLKRSYHSSFQKGDMIFDLDEKGKIIGLELLNASQNFGISKNFLRKMREMKIEIETNEELIKIRVIIKTLVRNAEKTSALNLERIKPAFVNPSELNLAMA